MKAALYLLVILFILFYVLPGLRFLCKRLHCAARLTSLCRRHGFTLQGTHPMGFLGSRRFRRCDCVIETPQAVFAIKLFGVLHSARVLILRETGEYFFRRYASILMFIFDAFDGTFRRLQHIPGTRPPRYAAAQPHPHGGTLPAPQRPGERHRPRRRPLWHGAGLHVPPRAPAGECRQPLNHIHTYKRAAAVPHAFLVRPALVSALFSVCEPCGIIDKPCRMFYNRMNVSVCPAEVDTVIHFPLEAAPPQGA